MTEYECLAGKLVWGLISVTCKSPEDKDYISELCVLFQTVLRSH